MHEAADIGGETGRSLIYVHGGNFKPGAEDLMDINVAAMSAGLQRDFPEQLNAFHTLDKRFSYYGDLSNGFLAGTSRHYDDSLDVGDLRNALLKLKSIDRKKQFGVNRYDRLPGKTALREFAADVIAPILGSLGLSRVLIAAVAKDLAEYWNDRSDFGARVRKRVRQSLCETLDRNDRVLLVSHGTGCIVVYDVLWQLSHDAEFAEQYAQYKIDTWLTLGSPLGDSMVRRRILGAREKGRSKYPTNIVSWHNVSAEDDYYCHDNTLADDFRLMLKQRQISSVRDYRVYNHAIRYGKSDPHSSIGYLIHPRVAQIIADWLTAAASGPMPKSTL